MNNYDDYLPLLFIKFLKFLHFVNDAGEVIVLPLKFILGVLFFIYELKDYKKYQRKCLMKYIYHISPEPLTITLDIALVNPKY